MSTEALEDVICSQCACTNDCSNVGGNYHCPAFKILKLFSKILDLDKIKEELNE